MARKRRGRPKKTAGLKTSVTTAPRVRTIVELLVVNWQAKATAVIGAQSAAGGHSFSGGVAIDNSPGLSKGQPLPFIGGGQDEADYVSTWDEKIPPMAAGSGGDWQESGARPHNRPMRDSGLMTLEKARKVVDFTCSRLITFCRAALSGKPSWRKWQSYTAAIAIVEWERRKAYVEIGLAALTKGSRSGWQRISTTKAKGLPRGRLVTFSGKPAWAGNRGRPPLPESEWMNRYRSRLEKRRKKYKGQRRRIGRKPLPPREDGKPRAVRKPRPRTRPTVPAVPATAGVRPTYTLRLPNK